jgi:hypothetical protein
MRERSRGGAHGTESKIRALHYDAAHLEFFNTILIAVLNWSYDQCNKIRHKDTMNLADN